MNIVAEEIDQWSLRKLRRLNEMVISHRISFIDLVSEMNSVLKFLPEIKYLSQHDAMKLIVILGIFGSSILRHYQEDNPSTRASDPGAGLKFLAIGPGKSDFREYFNQLALISGTGHPMRDAYASLVRWNGGAIKVRWDGQVVSKLPGVFEDSCIRTYTEDIGENLILELFKRCEALEKAANDALGPLWSGVEITVPQEEVCRRFALATDMIAGVRRLMLDFSNGDYRGKLSPVRFINVFRQFAVHWDGDDIPPSGPQDVEFIKRDLLVGMGSPKYIEHIIRIFPGLLDGERNELSALFTRPSLPDQIMERAGVKSVQLDGLSNIELSVILRDNPIIARCYSFLHENAGASAAHLMLAKRFLFKPVRQHDALLIDDCVAPVKNDAGITGIAEGALERLNQQRKNHSLSAFDRLSDIEFLRASGFRKRPEINAAAASGLLGLEI